MRRAMKPPRRRRGAGSMLRARARRAADREDRVRGQLGEPDLGARAPAHPLVEHAPEDEHVGRARSELEAGRDHEPARLGPRTARAASQARDEHDDGDHDQATAASTSSEWRSREEENLGKRLGLDRLEVFDGEGGRLRHWRGANISRADIR